MNTYTGLVFNPLKWCLNNVAIEDVRIPASMMCRGNGHLRFFYSVGLHSINCAQEAMLGDCKQERSLVLHDATKLISLT